MKKRRYKSTIVKSIFYVLYAVPKANYYISHPDKYSYEQSYAYAQKIMNTVRKKSRTRTISTGLENLPKEGGYIMYSNHQGKYDALGILLSHEKPCAVLWDKRAAKRFLARHVNKLIRGKEIDLSSVRNSVRVINEIAQEVKEGKRYLIFPEGKYDDNKNRLQEFKDGCFLCALKSRAPIVPVAIYDSYRAMDINTFRRETTQVHFLEPITYDVYGNMKRNEIAELVKSRIQEKLDEIERSKKK